MWENNEQWLQGFSNPDSLTIFIPSDSVEALLFCIFHVSGIWLGIWGHYYS